MLDFWLEAIGGSQTGTSEPPIELTMLWNLALLLGYTFAKLTGAMNSETRQTNVDSFQKGEKFVFLISEYFDSGMPSMR